MKLEECTIAQLDAILDDIATEQSALNAKARAVMAERNRKIECNKLDHWGVTKEEYAEAKQKAAQGVGSLPTILNEYRRAANKAARELQVAKAVPADVGVKTKPI